MQNIIFDWTGVVKDCVHDHLIVVNKMFEEFGVQPLSLQQLKETWKQPYMDFYNMHVPGLSIGRQKEVYFKAFSEIPCVKPYEGMVPLLKKLKSEGKKMVLLSSDSSKSLLAELEEFDLGNIFVDMELEVHDKVDHIENLMARNEMKADNTIIVGDTNNEIESARKAGIKAVSVTWGLCSEKNLIQHNPDYIVHTVEELEKILRYTK